MIYWVSQSITPSMRLYYEQFHTKESVFDKGARLYVTVPTGTRPSTPQARALAGELVLLEPFTGVYQGWQTSRRR